ncbi:hypothetical protein COB21_00825 [Candidatus Aerophobetes bacterium]|uniref:Uncharacterized protein n=1 Tax=Aerophobetes bacterium TaxID=2030807 RepID=A0A2A4X702_UNCAE|nr:MAG: hypothetical protein COB21_00825 [Candidatus Aerophobetes bacterium]
MVDLSRFFGRCICLSMVITGLTVFADPIVMEAKTCSRELLEERREGRKLDMCWSFGENSHYRFESTNAGVYMEIRLNKLPKEFDTFIKSVQDCLIREEPGVWTFSCLVNEQEEIEINARDHIVSGLRTPDSEKYAVATRRVLKEVSPQTLDQDALTEIIRDKKVLFYTGAGLSIAANVPAMGELERLMGFKTGVDFVRSLERVIKHPYKAARVIKNFHNACLYNQPTSAHVALNVLSSFKNVRVITENLDFLHEASGMDPYRIADADEVRENLNAAILQEFDYVVCMGLSFDDRGFLGWYKEQNPEGKIIAVDLFKPTYLGQEDFWVQGNLQQIIPEVAQSILDADESEQE